jgi:hypothetical protein
LEHKRYRLGAPAAGVKNPAMSASLRLIAAYTAGQKQNGDARG